jgi:cyclophilin family peptidyl-prolyl cis-trans isomerase
MNINGVMSERIIAQLEKAKAPIMCAKFIEMCTKKDGYKGSKIYKVRPKSMTNV